MPIDCPSWTVDTPLRILTQRTNGLPSQWQPDTRPRTLPAPLGVMDKRGSINTSMHDNLRLPAASAISPISTALREHINNSTAHSACDLSCAHSCSTNHSFIVYVLVIASTSIAQGGVELGHFVVRSCNMYTHMYTLLAWFSKTDFCDCPSDRPSVVHPHGHLTGG